MHFILNYTGENPPSLEETHKLLADVEGKILDESLAPLTYIVKLSFDAFKNLNNQLGKDGSLTKERIVRVPTTSRKAIKV